MTVKYKVPKGKHSDELHMLFHKHSDELHMLFHKHSGELHMLFHKDSGELYILENYTCYFINSTIGTILRLYDITTLFIALLLQH